MALYLQILVQGLIFGALIVLPISYLMAKLLVREPPDVGHWIRTVFFAGVQSPVTAAAALAFVPATATSPSFAAGLTQSIVCGTSGASFKMRTSISRTSGLFVSIQPIPGVAVARWL
jgi:hypothetical protein